jgi:hypothetical protein
MRIAFKRLFPKRRILHCLVLGVLFSMSHVKGETGTRPWAWPQRLQGTLLLQNQPNPTSAYTVISFYLAQSGPASLTLYTASGRFVGYFLHGFKEKGWYSVGFRPGFIAMGEYFYRLSTPADDLLKKMIVVR